MVMSALTSAHKEEVEAEVAHLNYSGFKLKVCGNITRHCGSFVGRDYKACAQMAPFIISPYVTVKGNIFCCEDCSCTSPVHSVRITHKTGASDSPLIL